MIGSPTALNKRADGDCGCEGTHEADSSPSPDWPASKPFPTAGPPSKPRSIESPWLELRQVAIRITGQPGITVGRSVPASTEIRRNNPDTLSLVPWNARSLALILCSLSVAWAGNWPGFRGPTRQGVSSEGDLPLQWTGGRNVLWKTPTTGNAWSSPIVWGDRIFLTTATDGGSSCHVLSLDTRTGRVLWDRHVLDQQILMKRRQNSYASPTPVTDGQSVFAVFADGGIVALDFDGNVLWRNRDFEFFSEHGLGASPILHKNLLIMAFDPSSRTRRDEKIGWKVAWEGAAIWALDKETGELVWEAKRGPSRLAHVTPNLMQVDGAARLISAAGDVIQGFDPDTGKRL